MLLGTFYRFDFFTMTQELTLYDQKAPVQASTDAQLIEMWLHDRPVNTQKAYRQHLAKFQRYSVEYNNGFPIRTMTLGFLQAFQDWLNMIGLKTKSIQCHMSTVKSLFTFAQRLGYIQFNPAAVIKLRKPKDTLAQRLLDRATVIKMIDAEQNPRNRALMRLLYVSGIRSSEAINLRSCDLLKHETGGQITVTAKGGKTLAVWIDQTTWEMINGSMAEAGNNTEPGMVLRSEGREAEGTVLSQPVSDVGKGTECGTEQGESGSQLIFRTSTGRQLHLNHVLKIVRAAAKRVGINKNVSPHWLRHATATHLMDAGVSLVAIKEHLGHETIQTTTRYTHVKPSAANAKLLAW